MFKKINHDVKNQNSKTYDYHDLAVLTYEYCDDLAKDIGNKIKYSKLNPKYWILSPEHDLWAPNNK